MLVPLNKRLPRLGSEIACVITEPVTGNMNCILPEPGFMETMRSLCTKNGSILIFDEVMTGFRFGTQCAQGWLGIQPDITCFGKVIGWRHARWERLVAGETLWNISRP